jgi:hypothetical protein
MQNLRLHHQRAAALSVYQSPMCTMRADPNQHYHARLLSVLLLNKHNSLCKTICATRMAIHLKTPPKLTFCSANLGNSCICMRVHKVVTAG